VINTQFRKIALKSAICIGLTLINNLKATQLPTEEHIAKTYDKALTAYQLAWELGTSFSMNFGLWKEDTKNLTEAHQNLYRYLVEIGSVTAKDTVVDAGCGVGGFIYFLNQNLGCQTIGVNISEKQLLAAQKLNAKYPNSKFVKASYCDIPLKTGEPQVLVAIESLFHLHEKKLFFEEAERLLEKGGRIVIADYFASGYALTEPEQSLLNAWYGGFLMEGLWGKTDVAELAKTYGFRLSHWEGVSPLVMKSAKRIGRLGWLASQLLFPFYKFGIILPFMPLDYKHAKGAASQYKALKQGLWQYGIVVLEKE
jgi:cyclopropane fatty-acyl-phospholipid synthase-like methyltransferase